MDRLRVAVDVTPLVGPGTGVATLTRGAVTALAARDDVRLTGFGLTLRGRDRLEEVVPPNVGVVRRPMPAGPLTRLWQHSDLAPLEWWTGAVDVVHGTNFVVPPTRRAGRVVTVHDLTAVRYPELCTPASLRYPDLVRRAVARGAWVHTLTASIGQETVELLGVPPERVQVVPSGVDAPTTGDADAGRRCAGGRYVLALGTVEPRKGLPGLVRAFDRLASDDPDVRLVVAGPDGWGTAAFAAAVALARHGDRIVRLGWVDETTRSDLLAGAAVLAMPSIYEGFGYPALEAMAVGTPVVATTVGSLPEVIGGAARLVPAADPDALAGALAEVLSDEAVAADLVRRGRARVAEFSWTRCAEGLVRLYRLAAGAQG